MEDKTIRALGDPTRYRLLQLMGEHSYCVRALSAKCGLSESAVSQHLRVLREAGLVYGIKKKYYMHYRIDAGALSAVRDELDALIGAIPQPCHDRAANCPLADQICRLPNTEDTTQETPTGGDDRSC